MTDPSAQLTPPSAASAIPIITITDFLIHSQSQSPLNEPLNFSAAPGQLIAMTGKSGVGKTQFMLSVLHALPTNWYISGHIDICGHDPTKLTGLELQNFRKNTVSYLGQDPGSDLNPFQRVSTILGLGSPIHTLLNRYAHRQRFSMLIGRTDPGSTANNSYDPGSTANNSYDPGSTANNSYDQQHHYNTNWLIHELEITSLLRLLPSHLSGGQQRRVALAKTLSKKTPLILLDEPFAGQDPRLQLKLAGILQRWAKHYNLVIIFSTHNEEWIDIADEHVCINPPTIINDDQHYSQTDNSHTDRIHHNALADHKSLATQTDSNSNNLYSQQLVPGKTAELTPLVKISHLLLKNSSVTNTPAFSLTIANGEAIGLIGPSGSGKTSLAHGIIGRDAVSGTITVADQQLPLHLLDRSPAQRQLIELIPQNPLACLNPSHTIGRILSRAYRHSYAGPTPTSSTVAQGLIRVGLSPDIANRYPHELSGGQRQRISVARALAYRPKLLICDEITSALDSVNAQEINALLWDILAQEEIALLYITHHIEQVISRCSRVITL